MLATCPQQVVPVVLVDFGERHDTRTNGQHYIPQQTNQVSAWQDARESRPTRATSSQHPRENVARVGRVDEDVTRM